MQVTQKFKVCYLFGLVGFISIVLLRVISYQPNLYVIGCRITRKLTEKCGFSVVLLDLSMASNVFPTNEDLTHIVVTALKNLGGHGTNDQIRTEVIKFMKLDPDFISKIHTGNRTELEYKLAWARTLAKQKGLILNTGRMTWKVNS